MDRNIFEVFTKENGIILSKESIEIIKENVTTDEDVRRLVKLYIMEHGSKRINSEELSVIIRKNRGDEEKILDFEVKNVGYSFVKEIERYKIIKDKINCRVSQISSIKDEATSIFGCLYKDILGKYTLEDDTGSIEVDINRLTGDHFLFKFMYVGFRGLKENNKFIAFSAFLPEIVTSRIDNKKFIVKKFKKMILIHGYIDKERLELIITNRETTIVVIVGPLFDSNESILHFIKEREFNVIIVPNIKDFLAEEINSEAQIVPPLNFLEENKSSKDINKSYCEKQKIIFSTNPCFIDIYGSKIFISSIPLYKYKKNGDFIGKNYIKSFFRSYISQYNINPFVPPHLNYDTIPNIYVICQEYGQFEEIIDDVRIVSLPKYKEELLFLEYDLETFKTSFKKYENIH